MNVNKFPSFPPLTTQKHVTCIRASCEAPLRVPDGKRGEDSYYNQLSSAHEQLPELCPGDNSSTEETYASIVETALSREALLLRMFKTRPDFKVAAAQQKTEAEVLPLPPAPRGISLLLTGKLRNSECCKLDVALFDHHLLRSIPFFCVLFC